MIHHVSLGTNDSATALKAAEDKANAIGTGS